MKAIWQYSTVDLARAVAHRVCSAREVVEAHLARIEQVNAEVNAIVRVMHEDARAAADLADQALDRGEAVGPLHGVPFTIKENIDVAGLPTTWGVPALSAAIVPKDAPVVARLRAAGAIPIARTNLPDMGLRMVTESTLYGITRNPWDPERTAGGSSGGEAAALATGMTPLGIGNDLGGSLRNPANACGVVSLRPSTGRVPHAGFVPVEDQLLTTRLMLVQGPMARTVADVRLALQVMMGAHPRDPWSVSAPFAGEPSSGRMRVAVLPAPPGGSCDPRVSAAVRRAADALANAGYDVVETCPPRYDEAVALWAALLATDFGAVMDRLLPIMGTDGRVFAERFIATAGRIESVQEFSRKLVERDGIARAWSQFMATHPLLLTPTWTQLPFVHGFDVMSVENGRAVLELVRAVLPANLLGLPSACVPAGLDRATGLPVGVLVTGQRFREDLCLQAAERIEANSGVDTPIEPRRAQRWV
jgi:amidase